MITPDNKGETNEKPIEKIFSAALVASIAPAIAEADQKSSYKKERQKYSFEPPPMKSVRTIKTEIVIKMKGAKGKPVMIKAADLNKLLAAINVLVYNDRKAELRQIKTGWYEKVKSEQNKVIENIVNSPSNKIFAEPAPPKDERCCYNL